MIQHVCTARAKSSLILALFVALGFGPTRLLSASQSHSALDSNQRPSQSTLQSDKATESTQELHGDMLMAEKKYQAAIKEYEQAPKDSAVVANKMGMAYHYMLNTAAAKTCYERALKLNSKYPQAMNNLGTVYYSEKKYPQAEKLYKKAIKLSPRDASMYSNLGTLYFVRGETTKGAEAYRKAFSLDPKVFERAASGGVQEGISVQQRAIMNYSLAKTYANVGMNDRALQYLRMALDEGFNDRKKLMEDKEFADLRETPEFQQLMAERR